MTWRWFADADAIVHSWSGAKRGGRKPGRAFVANGTNGNAMLQGGRAGHYSMIIYSLWGYTWGAFVCK